MVRLTIAREDGDTFPIDIDLDMEIENMMALLEAETGIATGDQLLFHSGKQLTTPQSSLAACGVQADDILLVRQQSNAPQASTSVAGRNVEHDSEVMRRQTLGNPQLMQQLRQTQPELAAAAENDPVKFRELLMNLASMQESARMQEQHEAELLNSDPYNIEAQRKIEEAIRQQAVLENMETAMENMPESFGRVHMLYVNVEVNGQPVKAFVDSGAQSTIMSPSCAERCGIMRLLDTRFSGMARGVGTAKILGRVHSAQLKVGDLYLQCSFTILEGKDVDLLFGLDMLKRHQAIIDLAKDALIIQGREVPFLAEHELPKEFQGDGEEVDEQGNPIPPPQPPLNASGPSAPAPPSSSAPAFPGAGHSLATPAPPPPLQQSPSSSSSFPEASIASLINLGVGRQEAVQLLQAANGNVDVAASMLFGNF